MSSPTHDRPMTDLDRIAHHPEIAPLVRAVVSRKPALVEPQESERRAAVALLVRLDEAREVPTPQLLLIKRATYEGDPWSGHVALPGGRREAGDPSLERTVIRETWEETAIDIDRDGRLIGCLDEVAPRTPVLPPIIITPFVGLVRSDVEIVASPEVADWFWIDVAALRDPEISREVVLELSSGPRTVMSFQHGAHTIWGLTERILRQFLSLAP